MEGLLTTFPVLKEKLEIHYVAYPRPRTAVIKLVGEENQNLPLLILKEGDTPAFISDLDEILSALSGRHGIPLPHP